MMRKIRMALGIPVVAVALVVVMTGVAVAGLAIAVMGLENSRTVKAWLRRRTGKPNADEPPKPVWSYMSREN